MELAVALLEPTSFLAVALGGAIGGIGRAAISDVIAHLTGDRFPWATMCVNFSGCFLIGLLSGLADLPSAASSMWWLFAVTGILGSYTTVSSFSLQTLSLLQTNRPNAALANVAASVIGCLLAAAGGIALGSAF